jgi:hypothetical protein
MLTRKSRNWKAFIQRLSGPEGCNFRGYRKRRFTCHHDYRFTRRIMADMGYNRTEIEESIIYFQSKGGYCDCEVVFNV